MALLRYGRSLLPYDKSLLTGTRISSMIGLSFDSGRTLLTLPHTAGAIDYGEFKAMLS